MGAQFCVALLRLKRLTGMRNHQHLLDLESDIIGTQSKVVRLVAMCQAAKSHAHGCCVTGAGFFLQNGGYCKIVTVPICNLLNNVLP